MFLQTFMLAAVDAGLDTCPQEAWAPWREVVQAFVQTPREEMLSCGVAIGRADRPRPASALESPRMPLEQWARWVR